MERNVIFYFTNKKSLGKLDFETDFLKLNRNDPYKKYRAEGEGKEIYLVYDEVSHTLFKKFWTSIEGDNISKFGFVYHSQGDEREQINATLRAKSSCVAYYESIHEKEHSEGKNTHYKRLEKIIGNNKLTSEEFDEIWKTFLVSAEADKKLEEQYQKWLSAQVSEREKARKGLFNPEQCFFVATGLSDEQKDILEDAKTGLTVTSPEAFLNNYAQEDESEAKTLIVFCEQSLGHHGKEARESDYVGIKFVQALRRKKFRGAVLFVSFEYKENLVEKSTKNVILHFGRGHGFLQLTQNTTFRKISEELSKVEKLDDLSLADVIYHFTSFSGTIKEAIHWLENYKEDDHREKDLDILKDICEYHKLDYDGVEKDYEEHMKGEKNEEALRARSLGFLKNFAKKYNEEEAEYAIITPKHEWKVLWLDDEFDPKKEEEIINKLKVQSGGKVGVLTATSYEDAIDKWKNDCATGCQIKVIITDYRLKNANGELHQKQGYHFIQDLSESDHDIAIVAYSGLPRKFLIESFKHYGVRLNIYSKIDFPIREKRAQDYLVNEIILLGDKYWERSNNQPIGTSWDKWRNLYWHYLSDFSFLQKERQITLKANKNLNEIIRQDKAQEKLILSDEFYWHNQKTKASKERLVRLLETRRIILGIYCYFIKKKRYLTKVEVADLIHKSNEKNFGKDVVSDLTAKNFLSTSFLTLSDFPHGLLQEERLWLQSDSGLNYPIDKELEKHWKTIDKVKKAFSQAFQESTFLQGLLEEQNFQITKEFLTGQRKSELDEEFPIYFTKGEYVPFLRTAQEVKQLLDCIRTHLATTQKEVDYDDNLAAYVGLLRNILQKLGARVDIESKPFLEVESFIWSLKAITQRPEWYKKKTSEYFIDEELSLRNAPWEFRVGRKRRYRKSHKFKVKSCKEVCFKSISDKDSDFLRKYDNDISPYTLIISRLHNLSRKHDWDVDSMLQENRELIYKVFYEEILESNKYRNQLYTDFYQSRYNSDVVLLSTGVSPNEYSHDKETAIDAFKQNFMKLPSEVFSLLISDTDIRVEEVDERLIAMLSEDIPHIEKCPYCIVIKLLQDLAPEEEDILIDSDLCAVLSERADIVFVAYPRSMR